MGLRILVVEDVQDTADSMALLLQLWGYQSTVVYEGERACAVATAFHADVVFLDIGMPRMDGYEVAHRLRRLPGMDKALLVAITGHGMEADVQRCKEAGIDCHFLKPVDPTELQKALANAESLGQDQRQLAC